MNLVTLKNIQHGFGGLPLLDQASLTISPGERVCLIGRNGEGKSTLMKIIEGLIKPDAGEVARARELVIAKLDQEVPGDFSGSVFEVVSSALGEKSALLNRYHHTVQLVSQAATAANLDKLAEAQHDLEAVDGWQLEQEVETVISKLGLPEDVEVSSLSGGLKRRVLLARALVTRPALLLLDEPTNHLDLEAIRWMEDFLLDFSGSILFITHDREFLRRLATRIVELDRGGITDWPGDYDNYLRRRDERLNAEARLNQRFDKKLAQEEAWIRQGIKARRTRNEGRVRALMAMRETYRQRRQQQGVVNLQLQKSEHSARLVCQLENISYQWDDRPIIKNFSMTVLKGDRIGVIGPNGSGKSTLLNLLLGRLQPDQGRVKMGERLDVVFYDQLRDQINPDKTVMDNVAEGADKISINGREKHVISYLQDFLFTPDRVRQPAKALSGGERNRLMLARLFLKPANLLVLDEPTNDLDVETLELLEELLADYQGTLILVSHDRVFLDNVVTATLVLEGDGHVGHYVGGYADWEAMRKKRQQQVEDNRPVQKTADQAQVKNQPSRVRLSYKQKMELEALPVTIETLEKRLNDVQSQLSDPGLYKDKPETVNALQKEMSDLEANLEESFQRWEALEALR